MTNKITKKEEERFHTLLMGVVDGELTLEERTEFDRLLNEYIEFKREWKQYQKLKEVTQTMKFNSPPPEVWDKYWVNIYNRIERGIGWIIFSIGCIILLTYGIFKAVESIIADPQLEGIVKVGIFAVIAGIVILVVSVLREKVFTRKTDPYKEIQR